MKTFQSKSLLESRTVGLLKGLTLLFLGASVAVLATYGLSIDPGINNATQYIQKIILTSDGTASGATGIVLNGNGNAGFSGSVGIGKAPNYKLDVAGIINATGAIAIRGDTCTGSVPDYEMYVCGIKGGAMGMYNALGATDVFALIGKDGLSLGTFAGGSASLFVSTGGNVGIGLSSTIPTHKLEVNGTGKFTNDLLVDGNVGIGTSGPIEKLEIQSGNSNIKFILNSLVSALSLNGNSALNSGLILFQLHFGAYLNNLDGDLILNAKGGDNQIYLKSGGNVGIGKDPTMYALEVSGSVQANEYYYSSDKRFKKNITVLDNALDKILALNGYSFVWKNTGKSDIGVIAQEVEKTFPEIVSTDTEGYKSVQYGNLVAPLIESVKALNQKIEQQQKEIDALRASSAK